MPKILLVTILLLIAVSLFSDEIEEKKRQLRQLEQQLESAQQKAKQTESKKKQTQSELNQTSTLKRATDEDVRKLSYSEAVVRDSISAVNRRLENVNSNLSRLEVQVNRGLIQQIRIDKTASPSATLRADQHLLTDMIRNIKRNIDILGGFKVMLVHDYEARRREFGMISRNLRTQKTKSISYDRRIRNLQAEDRKLTQEQRELQAQIEKLRADAAALETLITRLTIASGKEPATYKFSSIRIPWPVKGPVIRSFGEETRSYGTSIVNNGIDIAVPEGTSVKAVDAGEVVFSDRYGGQGKLIIIDHKNGFFSVYAYNSDLLVNKGSKVTKGQVIAKSGMSGSATQPSLRFELRRDGKAVNPLQYLE